MLKERLTLKLKNIAARVVGGTVGVCARAASTASNFGERLLRAGTNRGLDLAAAWSVKESAGLSSTISNELWNVGSFLFLLETALRSEPPSDGAITTSIIFPVYDQVAYTLQCLKSLLHEVSLDDNEIIVVNNGSQDDTVRLLAHFAPRVKVINNESNRGFGEGCNQGAQIARGRYLIFLNNDTFVLPGWWRGLVETADRDPQVGAVGSQLFHPSGMIQEAGAIIWRDGATYLCGWDAFPHDSRFNFAREVDYCSGASLLVRKEVFNQLGGFDPRYEPAYYEDADLCMGVRSLGFKVIYQPGSRIIHYHGVTSRHPMAPSPASIQSINREKFVAKWREVLAREHLPYKPANIPRAMNRKASAGGVHSTG